MTQHYSDLDSASDWLAEENLPRGTTNQKHYPDRVVSRHQHGISTLSDVILRGNQLWCREMSVVFSAMKQVNKAIITLSFL